MFGRIEELKSLDFQKIEPRPVQVWLPPGAPKDGLLRPLLLAHDGQNLFDPATSYAGVDWGILPALRKIAKLQPVRLPIVVGVWNTSARIREYMPERPYKSYPTRLRRLEEREGGPLLGDAYLAFLVEELLPALMQRYPLLPEAVHRSMIGSSMGGIISLYGLCEYPEVFGNIACLSTHWPVLRVVGAPWLKKALPPARAHRVYLDRGTIGLEGEYEPYQDEVDRLFWAKGYRSGPQYQSLVFEGADHTESAWRARVHRPLAFLLGNVQVAFEPFSFGRTGSSKSG